MFDYIFVMDQFFPILTHFNWQIFNCTLVKEIFGPVLAVISFRDTEEALRIANDSVYGLKATLWTNDIKKAHSIARSLRAGTVIINSRGGGGIEVPFGGYKQSGFGRDKSLHALEKYTQLKTTFVNLN